jgi:hypothetical protein
MAAGLGIGKGGIRSPYLVKINTSGSIQTSPWFLGASFLGFLGVPEELLRTLIEMSESDPGPTCLTQSCNTSAGLVSRTLFAKEYIYVNGSHPSCRVLHCVALHCHRQAPFEFSMSSVLTLLFFYALLELFTRVGRAFVRYLLKRLVRRQREKRTSL